MKSTSLPHSRITRPSSQQPEKLLPLPPGRRSGVFKEDAAGFEILSDTVSFGEVAGQPSCLPGGDELLNHFGGDLEDTRTAAEDNYCGCYQSLAEYAQELTEETTQIPENLTYYIDYERMGRDMEMSGDVFTIATGYEEIHIFWNH